VPRIFFTAIFVYFICLNVIYNLSIGHGGALLVVEAQYSRSLTQKSNLAVH